MTAPTDHPETCVCKGTGIVDRGGFRLACVRVPEPKPEPEEPHQPTCLCGGTNDLTERCLDEGIFPGLDASVCNKRNRLELGLILRRREDDMKVECTVMQREIYTRAVVEYISEHNARYMAIDAKAYERIYEQSRAAAELWLERTKSKR